jgi:Rrf2 family protein
MLRLPDKLLFAIEAVVDIAYHGGGEPVQSKEITRRQGIPARYLEQALQQLVRAGVLLGVRGPRGGYRLARERRRVAVGEVVRAIGAGGDSGKAAAGSALGHKVVRPLWTELYGDVMTRLDATTIEDLCRRAQLAGVASESQARIDFTI